jgi:hypothetical protein
MLFAAVHVLLMTDAVEKSVTNGESSKSFFNNIDPKDTSLHRNKLIPRC